MPWADVIRERERKARSSRQQLLQKRRLKRASASSSNGFGPVTGVEEQLHRVRDALVESADAARAGDEEQFVRRLGAEARAQTDPEAVVRLFQAAPPEQLFLGLERYWRKKAAPAEPTGTEAA